MPSNTVIGLGAAGPQISRPRRTENPSGGGAWDRLIWLVSPHGHVAGIARRRASIIAARARIFVVIVALLSAVMTVAGSLASFAREVPWLPVAQVAACALWALVSLVIVSSGNSGNSSLTRVGLMLFSVLALLGVSETLWSLHSVRVLVAGGMGYAYLPLFVLAGFSIFPLTLVEIVVAAGLVCLVEALPVLAHRDGLGWEHFSGTCLIFALVAAVSGIASIVQLASIVGSDHRRQPWR